MGPTCGGWSAQVTTPIAVINVMFSPTTGLFRMRTERAVYVNNTILAYRVSTQKRYYIWLVIE